MRVVAFLALAALVILGAAVEQLSTGCRGIDYSETTCPLTQFEGVGAATAPRYAMLGVASPEAR